MRATDIRGCEKAIDTIRAALAVGNLRTARSGARYLAGMLREAGLETPAGVDVTEWALLVVTAENALRDAKADRRARVAHCASYV